MIDRADKIEQLTELGYECKVENGILFVELDDYENRKDKVKEYFTGYKSSYGIRPKERKAKNETDDN